MNDPRDQLSHLIGRKGHLVPIRTVQEVYPAEETGEALVAEIDIKSANTAIKLLDSRFPRTSSSPSTSHLRRVAKPDILPPYLRDKFARNKPASETQGNDNENVSSESEKHPARRIYLLILPPIPEISDLQTLLAPHAPQPPSNEDSTSPPRIERASIPLLPPTSPTQAATWSTILWPTTYNPSARPASHAPPPTLLARTRDALNPRAGVYMALAERVADEAKREGRGRGVGAVVVLPPDLGPVTTGKRAREEGEEENEDALSAVVAVAGDARYHDDDEASHRDTNPETSRCYNPDDEGRTDYHSLMRAVSMVSHARVGMRSSASSPSPSTVPSSPLYPPPTPLESHFLTATASSTTTLLPPSEGGYLCTDLVIYSTHEPCLCCAMGMLLSRFRAVVVPARRDRKHRGSRPRREEEGRGSGSGSGSGDGDDGGGALDPETGYSLHWRAELNWRAMGFEFVEDEGEQGRGETEDGEGEFRFHA